jgi:hypothetical protein
MMIAAILIALVFVALAVRYWRNAIGAGPTILIVGALILFGLWGYNWTSDQDDAQRAQIVHNNLVADYIACASKVDRSAGNRDMWLYVRSLFHPTDEVSADFIAHLDGYLPELTLEDDCPVKP